MFPNPLWHIQLQFEAFRTKASVESLFGLFLGIQNQKYANVIPNRAELAEKTYELFVSNLETYHAISDKIAVTINSTIQNWAPSNWENLAKRSIYNYAIVCIQHAYL